MNEVANKRFRLGTKSAFNTPLRAEQVGNNRIAASLHSLEQQRWASLVYYTSVNLGHFKVGIYFGFDGNDVVLSVEQIEKCAKVRMHRRSGQYNPRRQRCVYRSVGGVVSGLVAGNAKDQPLNFSDLSGKTSEVFCQHLFSLSSFLITSQFGV
jgi:hypothetical protein